MSPRCGLVPLGRDPESGLFELAHLQTGAVPKRDGAGKLRLGPESGLVFVLVPGGAFRMGSVPPGEVHPAGAANVDPDAVDLEAPVHEVSLEAFLLAKHEMTQAQWERFTGTNPSKYGPGFARGLTPMNPVESVSWDECDLVLRQLGLVLPTEAQWERAARGGTSTVWWTGDRKESLSRAGNVLDASSRPPAGSSTLPMDLPYDLDLDDGYLLHAPVGSFRANPFGLHDVVGNVSEWCRDGSWPYTIGPSPRDGERREPRNIADIGNRVCRGGSYTTNAASRRSACRGSSSPKDRSISVGVRPARVLVP